MTKSKQRERAAQYGKIFAESMFEDFQDPKMRGKEFCWMHFPALAERHARVGCFTSFPHRIGEDIKEVAAQAAKKRAGELLRGMKW